MRSTDSPHDSPAWSPDVGAAVLTPAGNRARVVEVNGKLGEALIEYERDGDFATFRLSLLEPA